jgi:hypothetical protein
LDSKLVGGDVAGIRRMTPDPLEHRLRSLLIPRVDALPYGLDKVDILDRALTREPAILFPSGIPLCDALDAVLAVAVDLDALAVARDLERAKDSSKLGALVRLRVAYKTLRYVSRFVS